MMERRMERRREVDMILNVYQEGLPVLARAWDLSVSGMRLVRVLNPTCRPNEVLEIEFQLPRDREVLYARGECVYSTDDNGMIGIRFVEQDDELTTKLRSFVERGSVRSRGRTVN